MLSNIFVILATASLALSSPLYLEPRTDATNIKCTDANAYVPPPNISLPIWTISSRKTVPLSRYRG